jgi:hypothetical protein
MAEAGVHGSGASLPPGPAPVKVPQRGVPGRLAAVLVVGAIALVAGISLLDQFGDRPTQSPAALGRPAAQASPAATPVPDFTPEPQPAWSSWPVERPPGQRSLATGGTPLPDVAGALPGDGGGAPLPLGTITGEPSTDRLDFLFELCWDGCFRDAHWLDPEGTGLGSGVWTASRPFYVREGFVNDDEEPLGPGFDVVLYVTRLDGETSAVSTTFRFEPDYVLRGTADRCGPTYETQGGPRTCEWFVHDFPAGLPEGRWAIWAVWEAPCRAWIEMSMAYSCADPDAVMSLFASGFDAPYGAMEPSFTEVGALATPAPSEAPAPSPQPRRRPRPGREPRPRQPRPVAPGSP